ncbi:hypothetical protein ACFQ51_00005, partial [Streptomyces kaempferi]
PPRKAPTTLPTNALDLSPDQGLGAPSVVEVAQRTEANSAALNRRFTNRQPLLIACAATAANRLTSETSPPRTPWRASAKQWPVRGTRSQPSGPHPLRPTAPLRPPTLTANRRGHESERRTSTGLNALPRFPSPC